MQDGLLLKPAIAVKTTIYTVNNDMFDRRKGNLPDFKSGTVRNVTCVCHHATMHAQFWLIQDGLDICMTHPGFMKLMLPRSSDWMADSCCMLCCISACSCTAGTTC